MSHNHVTEEELVLHYYGEEGDTLETERRLEECDECRSLFGSLQHALNVVDSIPAPERGAEYEALVWQRIKAKLPPGRWRWLSTSAPALRWAVVGVSMIALLVLSFLTGRSYPNRPEPSRLAREQAERERVLSVAVGDCLERSQMVLIELANTNAIGPLDVLPEQVRAQELVSEARLYKQTAANAGATSAAAMLEELERLLLDIARGPSRLSPAELKAFRERLEAEGILFKIRVVNSNMRSQQEAQTGDAPRKRL